ncbi:MAG: hypothetical protein AAFR96_12120 [Planctomycetota bacterium]
MLIASGVTRAEARGKLDRQSHEEAIPTGLLLARSRLELRMASWREYWSSARPFFEVDCRLPQRLNRLKASWRALLAWPRDEDVRADFCWRYFGLLHHSVEIAIQEPRRPGALAALARIVGFESFPVSIGDGSGEAAAAFAWRHPVYLLSELVAPTAVPTPKHLPLMLPTDRTAPFYHYRQHAIGESNRERLLIAPAVDLSKRQASFVPIDRLGRLVSIRPDPFWKTRAGVLAERITKPLLQPRSAGTNQDRMGFEFLDLGAGSGQLLAEVWRRTSGSFGSGVQAGFHCVDVHAPSAGRAFGTSRTGVPFTHIEWVARDFRELLDDDAWLASAGYMDIAFACRVLDNVSTFFIEHSPLDARTELPAHKSLAPGEKRWSWPAFGSDRDSSAVEIAKRARAGCVGEYLNAMQAITQGTTEPLQTAGCAGLVRRFNPAALITPSGRSVIGQVLRIAGCLVIEDIDLEPEHLRAHRASFGLAGHAAVRCAGDGFLTRAHQYVIGRPEQVQRIKGERLW